MKRILILAATLACLRGEIVDRIVVTVDKKVITEGQLDEELRVTALLNHEPIGRDREKRRAAADRLIQQTLISKEMDLSRYPVPSPEDVSAYYEEVVKQYGGTAELEQALVRYSVRKDVLLEHLRFQLMTLRFLAYRFQPEIDISDKEIAEAYQKKIADWKQAHTGTPPSLEESRETIKKSIMDERTDFAFSNWLEESRKQVQITYLDPQLQ
ncbi:MAG: hypothetical protein WBW33_26505 [Bryobacteraceae bacterium]